MMSLPPCAKIVSCLQVLTGLVISIDATSYKEGERLTEWEHKDRQRKLWGNVANVSLLLLADGVSWRGHSPLHDRLCGQCSKCAFLQLPASPGSSCCKNTDPNIKKCLNVCQTPWGHPLMICLQRKKQTCRSDENLDLYRLFFLYLLSHPRFEEIIIAFFCYHGFVRCVSWQYVYLLGCGRCTWRG